MNAENLSNICENTLENTIPNYMKNKNSEHQKSRIAYPFFVAPTIVRNAIYARNLDNLRSRTEQIVNRRFFRPLPILSEITLLIHTIQPNPNFINLVYEQRNRFELLESVAALITLNE